MLTDTTEKSDHPSLDSMCHFGARNSRVSEVRAQTVQIVHETLTFTFVISWRDRVGLIRNVHVFYVVEILHNDSKLASRFKFGIDLMIRNLQSHRGWSATNSLVFQLSMSSTSNVSQIEFHTPIATIRIDLRQGHRGFFFAGDEV